MSDEPNVKIPTAWLKTLLPPILAALLAATGASKYVETDVAAVRMGAVNRTDANEHEIKWLVNEMMELRSELKELKESASGEALTRESVKEMR